MPPTRPAATRERGAAAPTTSGEREEEEEEETASSVCPRAPAPVFVARVVALARCSPWVWMANFRAVAVAVAVAAAAAATQSNPSLSSGALVSSFLVSAAPRVACGSLLSAERNSMLSSPPSIHHPARRARSSCSTCSSSRHCTAAATVAARPVDKEHWNKPHTRHTTLTRHEGGREETKQANKSERGREADEEGASDASMATSSDSSTLSLCASTDWRLCSPTPASASFASAAHLPLSLLGWIRLKLSPLPHMSSDVAIVSSSSPAVATGSGTDPAAATGAAARPVRPSVATAAAAGMPSTPLARLSVCSVCGWHASGESAMVALVDSSALDGGSEDNYCDMWFVPPDIAHAPSDACAPVCPLVLTDALFLLLLFSWLAVDGRCCRQPAAAQGQAAAGALATWTSRTRESRAVSPKRVHSGQRSEANTTHKQATHRDPTSHPCRPRRVASHRLLFPSSVVISGRVVFSC